MSYDQPIPPYEVKPHNGYPDEPTVLDGEGYIVIALTKGEERWRFAQRIADALNAYETGRY